MAAEAGSSPVVVTDVLSCGVSLACYYGCPEDSFAVLDDRIHAADRAVAEAIEAGLDTQTVATLTAKAMRARYDAQAVIDTVPIDGTGPWRPTQEQIKEHPKIPLAGIVNCCKYAGKVYVGHEGLNAVTISNPALPGKPAPEATS